MKQLLTILAVVSMLSAGSAYAAVTPLDVETDAALEGVVGTYLDIETDPGGFTRNGINLSYAQYSGNMFNLNDADTSEGPDFVGEGHLDDPNGDRDVDSKSLLTFSGLTPLGEYQIWLRERAGRRLTVRFGTDPNNLGGPEVDPDEVEGAFNNSDSIGDGSGKWWLRPLDMFAADDTGILNLYIGMPDADDDGEWDGKRVQLDGAMIVPEPTTMALLGLGGLAVLRRRRR